MNNETYDWIYNVTRFTKNEKALCIFGPQASGKSLVAKMMADINGPRFTRYIYPSRLNNKFNSYLKDISLLIIEEADEESINLINELTSKKTLSISAKNEKDTEINNKINFLLLYETSASEVGIQNKNVIYSKPLPIIHKLYELTRNPNDA